MIASSVAESLISVSESCDGISEAKRLEQRRTYSEVNGCATSKERVRERERLGYELRRRQNVLAVLIHARWRRRRNAAVRPSTPRRPLVPLRRKVHPPKASHLIPHRPLALELQLRKRSTKVWQRRRRGGVWMRVGAGGAMCEPGRMARRSRFAVVEVDEVFARNDVAFGEGDELEEGDGKLFRRRHELEVERRKVGAVDDLLKREFVEGDEGEICIEKSDRGRGDSELWTNPCRSGRLAVARS